MPSFDIVSQVNQQEVKNAVEQTNKEITNRFDFKGSDARVEQAELVLTVYADDEFISLCQPAAQHVRHLAELELVIGIDRKHELSLLDAGVRALEVEAVGDLLVGLLDRVLHFLLVDLRDDVEGRHGRDFTGSSTQVELLQLLDPAQRGGAQPFDVLRTVMQGVQRQVERLAPGQHQRGTGKKIARRL